MLNTVKFPRNQGQRYYDPHYTFFLETAIAAGKKIVFFLSERNGRGFEIEYRGKMILIDFGDHFSTPTDHEEYDLTFRYHYSFKLHNQKPRTFPLTPISFHNWKEDYFKTKGAIAYFGHGDQISNRQVPGARALERREKVQKMLRGKYGPKAVFNILPQKEFWLSVNRMMVAVCVPGARNDILDRGQFQLWAFGVCTISPKLEVLLPWHNAPRQGHHYLECKDDYSDLIEVIEYAQKYRERRFHVGQSAKKMFKDSSTPDRIWSWIDHCISEV